MPRYQLDSEAFKNHKGSIARQRDHEQLDRVAHAAYQSGNSDRLGEAMRAQSFLLSKKPTIAALLTGHLTAATESKTAQSR